MAAQVTCALQGLVTHQSLLSACFNCNPTKLPSDQVTQSVVSMTSWGKLGVGQMDGQRASLQKDKDAERFLNIYFV